MEFVAELHSLLKGSKYEETKGDLTSMRVYYLIIFSLNDIFSSLQCGKRVKNARDYPCYVFDK